MVHEGTMARIEQARLDAEHAQSQTTLIMQLAQASIGMGRSFSTYRGANA